jgi:hypothetical protein
MAASTRFKGIEDSRVFKTGQYFLPGKYSVKINAVKWVNAAVGNKSYFIVETTVLASSNAEIAVNGERSHVIDMSNVMGLPNVKAFVAAVSGVDASGTDVNDQVAQYWSQQLGEHIGFEGICELICSDSNPLAEEEMDLECFMTKTKDGGDFTKHNWLPRAVSTEG